MADEKEKIVTDATGPDAGPTPAQPEAGGGAPSPKQEQPTPEAPAPSKAEDPEQAAPAQQDKAADAPKEQKAASVSVFNFSEIMAEKKAAERAAAKQEATAPDKGAPSTPTKGDGPKQEKPKEQEQAPKRRGRPPKEDKAKAAAPAQKEAPGKKDKAAEKPAPAKKMEKAPKAPKPAKGTPEEKAPVQPEKPPAPAEAPRPAKDEQIVYLKLSDLHAFKNHPFQVHNDEEMKAMVSSVRDKGVTQPAIVRPREDGGNEIVSGHRRQKASELAGFTDMPCIVRNLTDEQAITQMVEDNTNQRENILPSERAKALKMQLEAIKHQGAREATSGQLDPKDAGRRSNEIVAERNKMTVKANADLHYQRMAHEHPELQSNFLSRMAQKWKIKREYAKQAREAARQTAKAAGAVATTTEKAAAYAAQFVRRHKGGAVIILLLFCLFLILNSVFSALPSLGTGMMNAVVGTSYTAEDEDILGANEDYTALENELREKIANIERTHPGYDEYRYNVDELGHNPYELTSYLIAKLRTYTRENVQSELRALFEAQYKLTLTEEVEIRYRTETDTWTDEDGNTHTDTYEVPYEYYILHVRLQNKTLPVVVGSLLDAGQKEIYDITLELKGNKPYLWDDIYTGGGGSYDPGSDYTIPGEALSDPAFAALITEAEKYLGWPYVWGGSSPSTSFDCSGFVCWAYTASGVHDLSRTTATGIFNQCAYVSPADARPGDLIFFTKTYNCDGPV